MNIFYIPWDLQDYKSICDRKSVHLLFAICSVPLVTRTASTIVAWFIVHAVCIRVADALRTFVYV